MPCYEQRYVNENSYFVCFISANNVIDEVYKMFRKSTLFTVLSKKNAKHVTLLISVAETNPASDATELGALDKFDVTGVSNTPKVCHIWRFGGPDDLRLCSLGAYECATQLDVDRCVLFLITETLAESVSKSDEIGNGIEREEELSILPRQINLEVDGDDVQELLDSHN
ncbi:hypothetical protein TNCV_3631481 [Trichonephila clavipes]|nr:hypothetical protein TNCV_3631481 [Trichonephila clavipes]